MVDAVTLPETVLDGSTVILEDEVSKIESDSGLVEIIQHWPRRRKRITLIFNFQWVDDVSNLYEVNGNVHAFLIKLPRDRDHLATLEPLSAVEGSTTDYQLSTTNSTTARSIVVNRLYPDENTVQVFVGGVEVFSPATWQLEPNGVIAFGSPPAGAITATFEYYTAVRFDSDGLDITLSDADNDQLRQVHLVEVFDQE